MYLSLTQWQTRSLALGNQNQKLRLHYSAHKNDGSQINSLSSNIANFVFRHGPNASIKPMAKYQAANPQARMMKVSQRWAIGITINYMD